MKRFLSVLILAAFVGMLTACAGGPSAPVSRQASNGVKPGMDARGNVIDPAKVESGSGRIVKGINDYEGEVIGNPVPGSKFDQLQVGMAMKQVFDILGPPTDQSTYETGKRLIPLYFGGDTRRHQLLYKGKGRLIFSDAGLNETHGLSRSGTMRLIMIIHSANETGYN
jgi:hypothetical protein